MSGRVRIGIDARLLRAYGIGTYVRGLLEGLASLEGDEQYVIFAAAGQRALIPPRFDVVETAIPPFSVFEVPRFSRLAARQRLDLLHVPHLVVPWTDARVVATLHDAIPLHYPPRNPIAFAYIAMMMRRATRRADRVLTVSHAAKHDLTARLHCDPRNVTVIQNGIDERFFRSTPAPATDLGRYVLFVGRVARHKNVDTLLTAMDMVRSRYADLRVVLAGGDHPTRDGVVVPGYVDDERLIALYRGATALVMPSFMEGFGLPAAEAMAAGTPVITSTAPALVEITGDAAIHVDPRSAGDLAAAIVRLVEDGGLREELIARGRARAVSFRWRECAAQTLAVYREVLRIGS